MLFDSSGATLIQYPIGNTRTTYAIPASVTIIGESAFQGASSLTSITIPASVESIGVSAFQGASNLVEVTFTGSTIPSSISSNTFPDKSQGIIAYYTQALDSNNITTLNKTFAEAYSLSVQDVAYETSQEVDLTSNRYKKWTELEILLIGGGGSGGTGASASGFRFCFAGAGGGPGGTVYAKMEKSNFTELNKLKIKIGDGGAAVAGHGFSTRAGGRRGLVGNSSYISDVENNDKLLEAAGGNYGGGGYSALVNCNAYWWWGKHGNAQGVAGGGGQIIEFNDTASKNDSIKLLNTLNPPPKPNAGESVGPEAEEPGGGGFTSNLPHWLPDTEWGSGGKGGLPTRKTTIPSSGAGTKGIAFIRYKFT